MWKSLGLLAVLAVGPALAQPPQTLEPQDQIELAVGESRTMLFPEAFQTAGTASEGTAKLIPQSNRTLTVTGVATGQTSMFVQGNQGEMIYMANIIVAPATGHQVKVYGYQSKRGQGSDFIGYYCSNNGCGRPDIDKPEDFTLQSTTVTRPIEGGGTESTTRQRGH